MKELKVSSVGMIYDIPGGESVEALKDVSFELEAGRLLTLLGPSGCGKTTLLNILAGFLAPSSGEVLLEGDRITKPGGDRGMVFQQGALFEWLSVSDNISYGPRMTEARNRPMWVKVLTIVGYVLAGLVALALLGIALNLSTWIAAVYVVALIGGSLAAINVRKQSVRNRHQGRVNELLDIVGLSGFGNKQVYELSGGMQQRVALARCLANDPDMILMDEPLGALDALTREKMQSLILNIWKETGKTIILVTHSVEEALYLGDRLFVMAPRPGRIHRDYDLPFARQGLTMDARELKKSPEFNEKKEEILEMIWEMEEQIMGTGV